MSSEELVYRLDEIYLLYSNDKLKFIIFVMNNDHYKKLVLISSVEESGDNYNLIRLIKHTDSDETISHKRIYHKLNHINSFQVGLMSNYGVITLISEIERIVLNVECVDSNVDTTIIPSIYDLGDYNIVRLFSIKTPNNRNAIFNII